MYQHDSQHTGLYPQAMRIGGQPARRLEG